MPNFTPYILLVFIASILAVACALKAVFELYKFYNHNDRSQEARHAIRRECLITAAYGFIPFAATLWLTWFLYTCDVDPIQTAGLTEQQVSHEIADRFVQTMGILGTICMGLLFSFGYFIWFCALAIVSGNEKLMKKIDKDRDETRAKRDS